MTEIGDRITSVRQEGFLHVLQEKKGWNPYHASNEWAEADAWLRGAHDGQAFKRWYRHLPGLSGESKPTWQLAVVGETSPSFQKMLRDGWVPIGVYPDSPSSSRVSHPTIIYVVLRRETPPGEQPGYLSLKQVIDRYEGRA